MTIIIAETKDVLLFLDTDKRVCIWNRLTGTALGFTKDELIQVLALAAEEKRAKEDKQ